MKRYILAHWRGELSVTRSFLVNGVLGFGPTHHRTSLHLRRNGCLDRVGDLGGCRHRAIAVLALAVVVLVVFATIADIGLLLKASGRAS